MTNNGTQVHRDDDGDLTVWTQPRFVVSAIVVAIIVVLGVVLTVAGGRGDSTAATPAAQTPPAVAPAAAPGGCDLPAGDQAVPDDTPRDTRWELVGKMIAPTAPKTYGPAVVDDGFRTCFAHSPMGALYAAANFWATATLKSPPDVYRRLAARSAAQQQAIKASVGQEPGLGSTGGLQIAGFSFNSYSSSRAIIKLAFRARNGRLAEIISTMLWTGKDWRYEIPLDQQPPTSALSDLSNFIGWTGS